MNKLKPVVFVQGDRQFYRKNEYAQTILLKALSDGITDPEEMRKMAGLNSVAEVYRTLDKLAIRKEYHEALARQGITLDAVVSGIKEICQAGKSDSIRLKGYQTILRSLGLDKYEKQEDSGKSWEEVILNITKEKEAEVVDGEFEEYEVKRPATPLEEKERQEREKALGKQLYEEN